MALGVFGSLPEGCNLAVGHFVDGRNLVDARKHLERHYSTMIAMLPLTFADQTRGRRHLDQTVVHDTNIYFVEGWNSEKYVGWKLDIMKKPKRDV